MASVNKMTILGNLGRDPEVRHTGTGDAVTNVSIATTDSWKDKSGEKQESTEWHRVIFFGKLAEIAGEYLKKGSQVYVEGSLRTRKWQDKDGRDVFTTEVIASSLKMLSNRDSKSASTAPAAKAKVDSKPESTLPAKSAKPATPVAAATPAAPAKQAAIASSTADDDDDFF